MPAAHFVDTLLAGLDGEIAPIWITVALTLERWPEVDALREAFVELVQRTPRLCLRWCARTRRWLPCARPRARLREAVRVERSPRAAHAWRAELLDVPVDLGRDVLFQLGLFQLDDGRCLFVARLHHSLGDARALGRVLGRLWEVHAHGRVEPGWDGPLNVCTDRAMFALLARHWRATLGLREPRARLLAPRAAALRRDGERVGRPTVATTTHDVAAAPAFFAGLLATAARFVAPRATGCLRLRVPVDLSRWLHPRRPLANTCMAVPLELDRDEVDALADRPAELVACVQTRLAELVEVRGAPWAAALECLLSARLVPPALLRRHAEAGLLADTRTNTLVATLVGELDRYFEGAPLAIAADGHWGHTPTWGANAWTLRGRLVVNVSAFEGLWSPETHAAFVGQLGEWLEEAAR